MWIEKLLNVRNEEESLLAGMAFLEFPLKEGLRDALTDRVERFKKIRGPISWTNEQANDNKLSTHPGKEEEKEALPSSGVPLASPIISLSSLKILRSFEHLIFIYRQQRNELKYPPPPKRKYSLSKSESWIRISVHQSPSRPFTVTQGPSTALRVHRTLSRSMRVHQGQSGFCTSPFFHLLIFILKSI